MIDSHCHMLPGLDDGAKDLDVALKMANIAQASGIQESIVTPHHGNGVYENPRLSILRAVNDFQNALRERGIELQIIPGSELHLVPELPQQLEEDFAMTYADQRKAALVELPKHVVPHGAEMLLERIFYSGVVPIIAHPERNSELRNDPDRLERWIDMGCKFQLTTQSCSGEFGQDIQKICRYWCRKGWIHLIASDAHRAERRSPDIRAGYRAAVDWLGQDQAKILVESNPRKLKNGEDLKNLDPRQNRATGFFQRFSRNRG